MRERPILFSAPMVRAILDGRKTQTRRVIKPQPAGVPERGGFGRLWFDGATDMNCPFGARGDRLWVRETWGYREQFYSPDASAAGQIVYRADGPCQPALAGCHGDRWRPSIHMPRSACRLLLEVADVRVERLQSIGDNDARAEGCAGGHGSILGYGYDATPAEHFAHVWRELYGDASWLANPWVWVIDFKRVEVANG